MKTRTSLMIDVELKKKIGVMAVLQGKRLSAMIEEILRKGLEVIEKEGKKRGEGKTG